MNKNQMAERKEIADPNMVIYRVTHDLRAPLLSVKALVDLMRKEPEKHNLDYYFNMIDQSIDRMRQSIGDIIDSSRNPEKNNAAPVDFKRIAQEAIHSIRFIAVQEFVQIELQVDQTDTFFSDEKSLQSIFNNLLSNAIRYRDATKLSSVYLNITFDNKGAKIILKDNGIGIEAELLEKIFAKYFRVNHDAEGSGLGLFIVKGAVENLGGTIQVQSVVGKGTTFIIHVPNLEPEQA